MMLKIVSILMVLSSFIMAYLGIFFSWAVHDRILMPEKSTYLHNIHKILTNNGIIGCLIYISDCYSNTFVLYSRHLKREGVVIL